MSNTLIQASERLYNFLLQFYPKQYRQQFSREMRYVFSQSLKDAYIDKGEPGLIHFWSRTMLDYSRSVLTQHLENTQEGASMANSVAAGKKSVNLLRPALITAGILCIPLLGMLFSDEWNWGLFDFLVIGVLVMAAGLVFEFMLTKVRDHNRRWVIGLIILGAVLWLWAELAVGIFTTWGS